MNKKEGIIYSTHKKSRLSDQYEKKFKQISKFPFETFLNLERKLKEPDAFLHYR